MEMPVDFQIIPVSEVLIRVALASIFGFVLGFERTLARKPLGYRVYMIVCIITCLIAVMGLEMNENLQVSDDDEVMLDLGKIISGVLTGIGFLGAGAILHKGDDHVIGATTGSCIWAAGGLGLLIGFGFYQTAAIGFAAIIFILVVLNRILGVFLPGRDLDNE